VIRNDDVPRGLSERAGEGLAGLHSETGRTIPGPLELSNHELRIVIGVFDQQEP
jgi:hypothetical protein